MQRPVRHFDEYPLNWVDEIPDDRYWKRFYYSEKNRASDDPFISGDSNTNDILVERLVSSPGKEKGRDGYLAHWMLKKGNMDMWVSLPYELMVSILVRLPFSSFCSVKSVCKGWNVLMSHPDPLIMKTRDPEGSPPLAVMFSVQNCWVCYNPHSHQWHHLPTDFGISSSGCDGKSDQGTRVVAGSNGLLLVAPRGADPSVDRSVLWAINPVNKSERQLVTPMTYRGGQLLDWHLQVDDKQSSFKYFQIVDYGTFPSSSEIGVDVYDSMSNSWSQFFLSKEGRPMLYGKDERLVWSVVEFEGRVFTFAFDSAFCISAIEVHWREPEGVPGAQWSWELIDLPDYTCESFVAFTNGRLFVNDGSLLLAAVLDWELEESGLETIQGIWVRIWALVDNYPESYGWKEIASMPQELNHVLWAGLYDPEDPGKSNSRCRPQVDVQGGFVWVANPCLGVLDGKDIEWDRLWANCGVMGHIPSNSWWQVPNYWDSPNCKLDPSGHYEMLHRFSSTETPLQQECVRLPNSNCQPFLFSPCMDLIASQ